MTIIKETEEQMKLAIDRLHDELKGLRTGQANPAMFDTIQVEVYGSMMRLRDIAQISTPELRQLLITPFDANNSAAIGKAIEKANLGFNPSVEGNAVRINVPPMDNQLRSEMAKLCGRFCEEAKVRIRNARRHGNELTRKDTDTPEDLRKGHEKTIQELTDKYCKQSDEIAASKEKEISTI